jgi:hypothetical protein
MAQATVHLYDHRTGERRAVEGDYWFKPAWWTYADGANDSVRSAMMYPDGTNFLGSQFILNLIVVEKIVCDGQIVYAEEVLNLPPLVVAMLVAVNRMAHLEYICTNPQAQPVEELRWAAQDLKNQQKNLLRCTGEPAVLNAFNQTVVKIEAFVDAAGKTTSPVRRAVLADAFEDSCFDFRQLVQAACGVLKKRRKLAA